TEADAIPEEVSQRKIKRMIVFTVLTTGIDGYIFICSYIIIIHQIYEVPTTLVLLSTLGCFGLGVLGLSYGVLSASWEEEQPGSRLGWAEFQVNFRRMVSAWKKPREEQ
ncbi:MAG: PAM68 family protein, partial [Cyanobacteria bacterium J06632_22]